MRVLVTDTAGQNLSDLYLYIAEKAGVMIAESFVGGMHRLFLTLAEFPHLGKQRHSSKVPDLRTFPYKEKTMIAYTVDEKTATVIILGVFHGGQDYEANLEIGPDNEEAQK